MEEFDCPVILNPEIICRMCLESTKTPLCDLFVKEIIDGQLITLPTLFQQLFRIKLIKNDGLPQRICPECKQKLIDSIKFKLKCETSNKVLHDVLQPGYDYTFFDTKPESPKAVTSDSGCQTDEIPVIKSCDEDTFEDGMEFYKLKRTIEKDYGRLGDEFISLCEQYISFNPNIANFCSVTGCDEKIPNIMKLQKHMREKHPTVLKELNERLDLLKNDKTTESEIVTSKEPYTVTEGNEFVEIEEYEEEIFEDVEEEGTKDDSDADTNIVEITNVSYHCPICHKLYQGHDEIEKHQILHEIVLPSLFESMQHFCCQICNAVFITLDQLGNHFNDGHATLEIQKTGNDRKYKSLPKIQTKLSLYKERTVTTAEGEESFLEMYETDTLDDNSPLVCGICQISYNSIKSIKYHIFSHFETFNCPFTACEAEFDFAYKLITHIRYTHFKEKIIDLTCPYCKEQFPDKREYGNHLKHSCKKRNVACVACSKMFVNQAALKNHLKIHQKHLCEECDETYVSNAELRQHLKDFHKNDNKMYKCSLCPKRFRTPSHRTDHEQTHNTENKYQCEICSNYYKSERVLKSHMKLHTVGRSHACPDCGKMFNRNYHVKLHMKSRHKKS